ncbi:hypothetical protein B0T10DRAFT_459893 [Thelonectria olida]|uniref:Uncharacterized protein n=1 Tax=Thelonectria olida TaxID=1576542 RepID=A0A9P8W4L5_9HYPO|nr:hypothetical protein B0T10DRAFT_459893 [Thelonectria olida]
MAYSRNSTRGKTEQLDSCSQSVLQVEASSVINLLQQPNHTTSSPHIHHHHHHLRHSQLDPTSHRRRLILSTNSTHTQSLPPSSPHTLKQKLSYSNLLPKTVQLARSLASARPSRPPFPAHDLPPKCPPGTIPVSVAGGGGSTCWDISAIRHRGVQGWLTSPTTTNSTLVLVCHDGRGETSQDELFLSEMTLVRTRTESVKSASVRVHRHVSVKRASPGSTQ